MSKSFRGFAAVLAVVLAGLLAWPAVVASQGVKSGAGAYYYFFQVVNENDEPFTTPGAVRCSIYNRGMDAGANPYVAHTTNQLSNNGAYTLPLASNDNGIIHWYSTLNTPVNVKCFSQYGDYAYKNGLLITSHKVRMDTSGAYKISRFPYVTNAGPTLTGIVIPPGGLVTDVAVEVVTGLYAPTDVHIDVGFAGNHTVAVRNALVNRMRINNPGFNLAHSATGTFANGALSVSHMGVALVHVSAVSGLSLVTARPYLVHMNSGLEVTYDTSNVAGIGGHVYIFWRMLHVGYNSQGLN
jgi:hypothetical protein